MGNGHLASLEAALQKLVTLAPESVRPEAYYDLAALKAMLGKNSEALDNLRIALDLNAKRLQGNPSASDLAVTNRSDPRFDACAACRNSKRSFHRSDPQPHPGCRSSENRLA